MIATVTSISEAFRCVQDCEDFSLMFLDYLDRFREDPDYNLLAEEPKSLKSKLSDEGVADAHIAALAVSLSQEIGILPPEWTRLSNRYLKKPWFAAKTPNLRAILLQESPAAFRVRNLFVSANALSRA